MCKSRKTCVNEKFEIILIVLMIFMHTIYKYIHAYIQVTILYSDILIRKQIATFSNQSKKSRGSLGKVRTTKQQVQDRRGWYWQCCRQVGSGKESPTPMLLIHSMIELLFKNFFYSFQYILNIILWLCGKNGLITCQKVRQGLVGRF